MKENILLGIRIARERRNIRHVLKVILNGMNGQRRKAKRMSKSYVLVAVHILFGQERRLTNQDRGE